jgi:hypothetical protein
MAAALQQSGCVSRAGTRYTASSVAALVRTLGERDAAVAERLRHWEQQRQASEPRMAELHALLTAAA